MPAGCAPRVSRVARTIVPTCRSITLAPAAVVAMSTLTVAFPGERPTKNARFSPLAKMLTAQPCQGVAEKVSLPQFVCSVSRAAGQGRHPLHANGSSPGNGEEREASNE